MFQETTTGSNLSRKGILLMAEVLQLANKVLPLSLAAKIQVRTFQFELLTTADLPKKKQARPGCFQACVRLQARGTQDHWYICVIFN
jgi:hypothetical protein